MKSPAEYLNSQPADAARADLLKCCASPEWAERMMAARPFQSDTALFEEAERAWWTLRPAEWLEAFRAHPRIGEKADPGQSSARWSAEEQSRVSNSSAAIRAALAAGNREYEDKFGYVYLVCATGRSADDLELELRRRLDNDPESELRTAAGEQAKITRLRLKRLGEG